MVVQVQGVTKEFVTRGARVQALNRVDLDIAAGEFVSVVGPSGCGKSTLMMMIAGLMSPSQGQVRIRDQTLKGPFTDVGIVFQRDALLEWRTVLGNVLVQAELRGLPKGASRQRATSLLHQVGLEGFLDRYPAELSGGMRQRVSLCRALIHDPPLLLMDEPFGALDALTRERMMVDLQQIWEQTRKTVLFITHSVQEAVFLSDRVVVMSPRPGRIEATLAIDLPRPRMPEMLELPEFDRYAHEIRTIFRRSGVL